MVTEMRHPHGFSFTMERKIALLRDVPSKEGRKRTWGEIADQVTNLQGHTPRPRHVANTYRGFNPRLGRRRLNYHRCGRRPHPNAKEIVSFLIKKLRELRCKTVCTSTVLQRHLAKEKGVQLSDSWIRKKLASRGYRWRPKRQKRKYTPDQRKARKAFAEEVLAMSGPRLRQRLAFAMDGVILAIPPSEHAERMNFCKYGDEYMWRKASESFSPSLAGHADYGNQVPLSRAVPMWGGCSEDGFAIVAFHPRKKLASGDWAQVVGRGDLTKAIKAVNPERAAGPWSVLCDNESFLRGRPANIAHKAANVKLWRMPPHSPDLNPIERFWSWLRKKLRAMDLKDAVANKPILGKTALRARIRRLVQSKKAQSVAANQAKIMKRVCREVLKKKGAATGF